MNNTCHVQRDHLLEVKWFCSVFVSDIHLLAGQLLVVCVQQVGQSNKHNLQLLILTDNSNIIYSAKNTLLVLKQK